MINLKELRKASGKNQSEIARLLGVTQQTYANYENGRTEASYDTLVRISKVFNLTVDEVISKNEDTDTIIANPMVNLKQIRKSKGISQEQLGKHFGFVKNTISQYETGMREPNLETLKKFATYFNVSIDYLVGYDGTAKETVQIPQYTAQQKYCIDMLVTLSENQLDKVEAYISALYDANKEIKKEIKY